MKKSHLKLSKNEPKNIPYTLRRVCLKYLKRNRKEGKQRFQKKGQTGSRAALKRGARTPLRAMRSVFTLYFKFLRCLKVY